MLLSNVPKNEEPAEDDPQLMRIVQGLQGLLGGPQLEVFKKQYIAAADGGEDDDEETGTDRGAQLSQQVSLAKRSMQRATACKDECQKRVDQLREELEQAEESLAAAKETAATKSREWAAMVRPEGGAAEAVPTPSVAGAAAMGEAEQRIFAQFLAANPAIAGHFGIQMPGGAAGVAPAPAAAAEAPGAPAPGGLAPPGPAAAGVAPAPGAVARAARQAAMGAGASGGPSGGRTQGARGRSTAAKLKVLPMFVIATLFVSNSEAAIADHPYIDYAANFGYPSFSQGSIEISLRGRGLSDGGAADWCLRAGPRLGALAAEANGGLSASVVDLSENRLGGQGVHALVETMLSFKISVRVLKLHKNHITPDAATVLARYIRDNPNPIEELHLSHNRLDRGAALALVGAMAGAGRGGRATYPPQASRRGGQFRPAWLRLEPEEPRDGTARSFSRSSARTSLARLPWCYDVPTCFSLDHKEEVRAPRK
ncbi:unnamed protein product, partial [Prorocentrum cordatum]